MKKRLLTIALLLTSPCWAAFRSCGTATSSPNNATTSLTAGAPASLAANDILLMAVSIDNNVGTNTISWSGGTAFFGTSTTLTFDGQHIALFWKRAVGGDSMVVTLSVSPTASWVVQACAWNGRDTTNPPVASTLATNNTGNASPTTVTANGVTALLNDDLVWVGFLDSNTADTFGQTQPTGYTVRATTTDTLDHFDEFAIDGKDAVAAGATGSVAGTLTHAGSAGWAAVLIRIPAAGGTVTMQKRNHSGLM